MGGGYGPGFTVGVLQRPVAGGQGQAAWVVPGEGEEEGAGGGVVQGTEEGAREGEGVRVGEGTVREATERAREGVEEEAREGEGEGV